MALAFPRILSTRIFDPMVGDNPNGTGLGLSIARELVQRHGGLIELGKYKGHTSFSVYLPFPDE